MGPLCKLKALIIEGIDVGVLPASIRSLRGLSFIDLDDNKIRSLPDWIGELSLMEHLYVARNALSALPESLRLLNLQHLSVSGNTPLGLPLQIPDDIINPPHILYYYFRPITAPPPRP